MNGTLNFHRLSQSFTQKDILKTEGRNEMLVTKQSNVVRCEWFGLVPQAEHIHGTTRSQRETDGRTDMSFSNWKLGYKQLQITKLHIYKY